MGAGGGDILILWAILFAGVAADVPAFHLDPVQGPAALSGRMDSILRDSLRVRSIGLFPLDSLHRLEERGEWSPGERSPASVARILTATHRPAMGWMRMDDLESTFERVPWWYFWAKRVWILRGEAFRATSDGIVSRRVSARVEMRLGFVGTNSDDRYPPTPEDRRIALDTLSRLVVGQALPVLLGLQKP